MPYCGACQCEVRLSTLDWICPFCKSDFRSCGLLPKLGHYRQGFLLSEGAIGGGIGLALVVMISVDVFLVSAFRGTWINGNLSLLLIVMAVCVIMVSRRSALDKQYPACGACKYNVSGNVTVVCPECGRSIAKSGVRMMATSRQAMRWVMAGWAILIGMTIIYILNLFVEVAPAFLA